MEALRAACKKKGAPHLPGCVVYTSAQPCPMCYTACMWARVDHVYYAATYEDVLQYGKCVSGGTGAGRRARGRLHLLVSLPVCLA
jgi:tRNA(Arg) A34 adenosine deaminase TadA